MAFGTPSRARSLPPRPRVHATAGGVGYLHSSTAVGPAAAGESSGAEDQVLDSSGGVGRDTRDTEVFPSF